MCSQKNRGGTLKETVLWTNPNPSATFAEQTISLSDNYANYDYLKIEYAMTRTNLTSKNYVLVSTEDFATYKDPDKFTNCFFATIGARGTGVIFTRTIKPTGTNSLNVGVAARITSSAAGAMDNNTVIPLNIYGVK